MRPIISTRELAEAINVSESSLKRWADDGLIQVSRTAGGHRRIAIGEAIRFIRSSRSPLVRPDILGLADLAPVGEHVTSPDSPSERLFAHLRDGRASEARGLMLSQYLAGQSVAEIADGPIKSALEQLGELWKHDPAGIYVEHRAVDICIQAVQQLRQFGQPRGDGWLALGGAPTGDPYLLPSLLAAIALSDEGWLSMNLGPDTPVDSLGIAADRHAPQLVWLSVSSVQDARNLESSIKGLAVALASRGSTLIVGGRASSSLALADLPIRLGASIGELIAVANELRVATNVERAGSPA